MKGGHLLKRLLIRCSRIFFFNTLYFLLFVYAFRFTRFSFTFFGFLNRKYWLISQCFNRKDFKIHSTNLRTEMNTIRFQKRKNKFLWQIMFQNLSSSIIELQNHTIVTGKIIKEDNKQDPNLWLTLKWLILLEWTLKVSSRFIAIEL